MQAKKETKQNTQPSMKVLIRLLKDMKEFTFQGVVMLISSIVYVVCSVLAALYMKNVLAEILRQVNNNIYEMKAVLGVAWVLIIIYCFTIFSRFLMSRLLLNITVGTMYRIRTTMYDHMLKLPIKYFDSHSTGDIMSRYTNDIATLRNMINHAFPEMLISTLSVIGTFAAMLILSPLLSVSSILMMIVSAVIILTMSKRSRAYFKKQQEEMGKTNGYAEEYIKGQKVVRVFSHEKQVTAEFQKINSRHQNAAYKAESIATSLFPIMGNLAHFTYALTAMFGAFLILKGFIGGASADAQAIAIATLITFLQLSREFSRPILNATNHFNSILVGLAGAERIYSVFDQLPEVDDGKTKLVNVTYNEKGEIVPCDKCTNQWAWETPNEDGSLKYTKLKGDVRFHSVKFCYVENQTVLDGVDLYAKPEQKIAFVGSTGAGKTTITNLINRFYELPFGNITYDGIDINKIKKSDLRKSLAMVLQDTHLFEGTIKENIRYGKLDATDEEIYEAAKLAHIDDFVSTLPEGYDTMISANSDNLSQGQRQMISIARAAVANAPVIILDEATSSIDTRTEKLIQNGMDRLMHGRTTFVIAHRLSTIKNANAILVLENGEIIERGTHKELIDRKGRYFRLYTGKEELV